MKIYFKSKIFVITIIGLTFIISGFFLGRYFYYQRAQFNHYDILINDMEYFSKPVDISIFNDTCFNIPVIFSKDIPISIAHKDAERFLYYYIPSFSDPCVYRFIDYRDCFVTNMVYSKGYFLFDFVKVLWPINSIWCNCLLIVNHNYDSPKAAAVFWTSYTLFSERDKKVLKNLIVNKYSIDEYGYTVNKKTKIVYSNLDFYYIKKIFPDFEGKVQKLIPKSVNINMDSMPNGRYNDLDIKKHIDFIWQ